VASSDNKYAMKPLCLLHCRAQAPTRTAGVTAVSLAAWLRRVKNECYRFTNWTLGRYNAIAILANRNEIEGEEGD
jgi:hypothetical protein